MQFFTFTDKSRNSTVYGMAPHNDEDCKPFDYFRFGQAEMMAEHMLRLMQVKEPQIPWTIDLIRPFALKQVDELIGEQLSKASLKPELKTLLSDNSLSKKEQVALLKGMTLTASDILWLNREAQDEGYLLNIYNIETFPAKFDEKKKPACYVQEKDGKMSVYGSTEMTDGEMRALLEQRKVVQARMYHKGDYWHCFFFTLKGLNGLEGGLMGSRPHYHYLSDKSNFTKEEIIAKIKACDMPSSEVHILIDRNA